MAEPAMFKPLPGAASSPPSRQNRGEWHALWPVPQDAPAAPEEHPKLGKPTARWTYRTPAGDLGGYIDRYDTPGGEKEIRPLTYSEHSDKRREWRWKSFEPLRPLYGLDRLAARPDAPVVVVEGEKAADAAGRLLPGCVVVTSPGGSNAAGKAGWGNLAQRTVTIWPDADEAGRTYTQAVARCLAAAAVEASIAAPPEGVAEGWDAADAEADGWDEARTLALIESAVFASEAMQGWHDSEAGPAADGEVIESKDKEGGGRAKGKGPAGPPQRDLIVRAADSAELWHDDDLAAYASIPINGHFENWKLRSRRFKLWLTGQCYQRSGGAPSVQAMQEALGVLEHLAIERSPRHRAWRRVAECNGTIYHDLCDDGWRAVRIGSDGWGMVDRPPVKFIRSSPMRALPEPESGEMIETLRGFVNVESEADFQIIVAWLLVTLQPAGPFPILVLNGEQGSAKSTTTRVLRALIDPNAAPIRSASRDERDLSVAADNNWTIVLDNLSGLPGWLSDALCRIATGGGFATRELHTNREEIVINAMSPIILNGITALDTRADLGDRSLVLVLPAIREVDRRTEAEFWADFDAAAPAILGALYDAVSCALRRSGERRVTRRLRMADFAEWIEAASPALGWLDGTFPEVYSDNQATAVRNVIEDSPLAHAIREIAEEKGEWEGSASELLPLVEGRVSDSTRKHRSFPSTPATLGAALARLAPPLRTVGVDARKGRVGRERQRTWTIRYSA
jgi:putative DNA primase/helicase